MYRWEKSMSEESFRKNHKNPSFSSSLLDEIYRSIDGGDRVEEVKQYKEKSSKKQSNGGVRAKSTSLFEDEEMASFRRACMIEKWMEKKVSDKVSVRERSLPEVENKLALDNDPLFFSSGSNSSDSSFGGFSSSENESFGASVPKLRASCFHGLKPVKTKVSSDHRKQECCKSLTRDSSELYLFDDFSNNQTNKVEEGLIKTKLRALKIYANLKKVKQPISPGGRLTSFINSLFNHGNSKKMKNCSSVGGYEDPSVERKAKSTQASSTCSSASSFSRSCLSKYSPNTRQRLNNGIKRTVRFDPVSVIVDEDSRPCGHKSIYGDNIQTNGRLALASNAEVQLHFLERTRKVEAAARDFLKSYHQHQNNADVLEVKNVRDQKCAHNAADNYDYEEDEDDLASDSSSDLFELDHLALFGNGRFHEELPVYETTHFDTNRAIASGFIR